MTKLDERAVEAACEAAAITIARQDGVELTPAGFRHGATSRPDDHAQMQEYMSAAITAYLSAIDAAEKPTPPAEVGGVEPVGYVTRAAIEGFDLDDTEIREVFLYPKGSLRPVNEFPLYPASALTAQAEEIERLRRDLDAAQGWKLWHWQNRALRAEAELAKARGDAMEEAAMVVDAERAECSTKAREHEASGELDLMRLWMGYGGTCAILSQSIRALKEKQP